MLGLLSWHCIQRLDLCCESLLNRVSVIAQCFSSWQFRVAVFFGQWNTQDLNKRTKPLSNLE